MSVFSVRPPVLGLAAAIVAGSLLVPSPSARANPVFTDAQTYLGAASSTGGSGAGCTVTTTGGGPMPNAPVVENGPATTVSTSVAGSFGNTANSSDQGTATSSATASGSVTASGGILRTIDFGVQSRAQLANSLTTSPCQRSMYSTIDMYAEFSVAQAGFLTLTLDNAGAAYGLVTIDTFPVAHRVFTTYGDRATFDQTTKIYLPAGSYRAFLEGEVTLNGDSHGEVTGHTAIHGSFAVAGSQIRAAAGKATAYVSFPGARSCAGDVIALAVTAKGRRARQIKKLAVFVNDQRLLKVGKPHRGAELTVPVARDAIADVRVEVTLRPRRKSRRGKELVASAAYEACA